MPCIAKVAVNDATIHFDKLYSYLVPPDFSESLWPGSIVLVPFGRGNHPRMAVVLEVGTEEAPDPRLKSLLAAAPDAEATYIRTIMPLKQRYYLDYVRGQSLGGDLLILACAVCFTIHILVIDHFTATVDGVWACCLLPTT